MKSTVQTYDIRDCEEYYGILELEKILKKSNISQSQVGIDQINRTSIKKYELGQSLKSKKTGQDRAQKEGDSDSLVISEFSLEDDSPILEPSNTIDKSASLGKWVKLKTKLLMLPKSKSVSDPSGRGRQLHNENDPVKLLEQELSEEVPFKNPPRRRNYINRFNMNKQVKGQVYMEKDQE